MRASRRIRPARRSRSSTSSGMVEPMDNPGTVTFEKDGKSLHAGGHRRGRPPLVPRLRRPHQRPRELCRGALPVRRVPGCARPHGGRFQQGLQPAVRVHAVLDLPDAAAEQPPRPGDHGRREEAAQAGSRRGGMPIEPARCRSQLGSAPPLLRWLERRLRARSRRRKPLLWKVSDGDNSIYLLGSFHALKPATIRWRRRWTQHSPMPKRWRSRFRPRRWLRRTCAAR